MRDGAKLGNKTKESISQMQKIANAEYFKDGGGPLFPGPSMPSPRRCSGTWLVRRACCA